MKNEENSALLLNIEGKGRCWCCWEEEETIDNPLIRVCHGCKDIDLQWIHQDCIDQYISLLPQNSEENIKFYCTRCKDPYQVESIRIHPLNTIKSDKSLLLSMILVSLCMIVITLGSIDTMITNYNNGQILPSGTPIWIFSFFILSISYICYIATWILVFQYCSKAIRRHVLPLERRC